MLTDLTGEHVPGEVMGELPARLRDVESRLPDSSRPERVLVLAALADWAAHAGQTDAGIDYSERALVLAQTLDDHDHEAEIREAVSARAFATAMAGRHLESRLFMEALVTMARGTGSPIAEAQSLLTFGVLVTEDDPRAALKAMLESAALSGAAGVRPTQGLALANASEGAADLGEWEIAERALNEAALLSRDDRAGDDGATMTRAMLTAHRDDPATALRALADLEARSAETWGVVVMMRTWFLRVRALCRSLAGDARGALADAKMSLELDSAGGNAPGSLWMAVQAGCALRDASSLRDAVEMTATLRGQWTRMMRATARAAIAALEGDPDAAEAAGAALDSWTAAELPLDHALATLCALHVLPDGEVPVADLQRARAYLEDLQATSLLRLYDAVS